MAVRASHFLTAESTLVDRIPAGIKTGRQETFAGIFPQQGITDQIRMRGNIVDFSQIKWRTAMRTDTVTGIAQI